MMDPEKNWWTPVWHGLVDDPEGKHLRRMKGAFGLFVYLLSHADRGTGRVYRYPVSAGKIPEDWWTDIETLNHSDRERTGWPSQKPERLVERILHAVTVEGNRVADWFAGSGTTAAVAQRLGHDLGESLWHLLRDSRLETWAEYLAGCVPEQSR